ncbi:MAG: hypothetical protein M3280_04295 [Actinomycetota bacterium]|nr:hypothetical protein [Actinomycetota bacterium]
MSLKRPRLRSRPLYLFAALSVLTGCALTEPEGSPQEDVGKVAGQAADANDSSHDADGNGSTVGSKKGKKAGHKKNGAKGSKPEILGGWPEGSSGSKRDRAKKASSAGGPTGTGGKSRTGASPDLTAVVLDPPSDAKGQGNSPAHADISRASIKINGDQATVSLVFSGELPRRTADEGTALFAGIEIDDRGNDRSIYAEGTPRGWKPGASPESFSGSFSIDGQKMVFSVPRSLVSNRNHFRWYAMSSWSDSSFTTTHYSFDVAPDDQEAVFPHDVDGR